MKAPVCADSATSCDSGTLLNGRGPTEINQPNTLFNGCPDGLGNGEFGEVHAIRIETVDGSPLSANKMVRVTVSWYHFSTAGGLAVSHAPDARHPTFTQIFNRSGGTSYPPSPATFTFVLPAGGDLQAIRAANQFDVSDDDCDDLVFKVQ
jgi:leucyl aminopeptidase